MNRSQALFLAILVFAFGTFIPNSNASVFEPYFRNYSSKHGLPSSRVYQIKQDSKGFIWMATDNGICRFDGNRFKNYTRSNGLCVNTLFGIHEDEQGLVWFYSYSGEVIYYDHSLDSIICPSFNDQLKDFTFGSILNGMFTTENTIYVYDYNANVYKIDRKTYDVSISRANKHVILNVFDRSNFIFGYSKTKDLNKFCLNLTGSGLDKKIESDIDISTQPFTLPSSAYDSLSQSYILRPSIVYSDMIYLRMNY